MKILVDCTPLSAGGGVQVAWAFLDGLRKQTVIDWIAVIPDYLLSSLAAFLDAHDLQTRVKTIPKSGLRDIWAARSKLREIEREFRPDVVFTIFGPAYFKAIAPHLIGFALPNLIYGRDKNFGESGWVTILKNAVRRYKFKQAEHIVVETETVRARLGKRLGIESTSISVVPNSVNPRLASYPAQPIPTTRPFKILIPSAYYPHKNLEAVPEVACQMRSQAPDVDFCFHFTLPPESLHWQRLFERAETLGVGDYIATLGTLGFEQLAAAYDACSAVFLPTLREASTAVYPEAFHFQRPLVTSDIDFARELCGDAAIYSIPGNHEQAGSAILSLLQNTDLVARQVALGRSRLHTAYPSGDEKFAQQVALLEKCMTLRSKDVG